jgi:hypothetical protein
MIIKQPGFPSEVRICPEAPPGGTGRGPTDKKLPCGQFQGGARLQGRRRILRGVVCQDYWQKGLLASLMIPNGVSSIGTAGKRLRDYSLRS